MTGATAQHHGAEGDGRPGHPAPHRANVRSAILWFGLFGAPAAWSVQELVNYAFAAHACYPRMFPLAVPTMGHARLWILTIVVSMVAIAVAVAAGVAALSSWRSTRGETGGHAHWALDTGEGRTRFMAVSALMTSALFLLAILVHTATILVLRPCW